MTTKTAQLGDRVEVTIDSLAYGGDGVARFDGLTVFVPFAAPGDRLRVEITDRRKNFVRARIIEVLFTGPGRREPRCRYFGACGGCQLQHLDYPAQLAAKGAFVRDALQRIGKIDWPQSIDVIAGGEFEYRVRAQIKVGSPQSESGARAPAIGFNKPGSHAVCDVESCPILVPELNEALTRIRAALPAAGRKADLPREFVMAAGDHDVAVDPAIGDLPSHPLTRIVNGIAYSFTPSTFFQGHGGLLDRLVNDVTSGLRGDVAIDLFAGVGLFSVPLARSFKKVVAVEADTTAARFCRKNLRSNDVANADVHVEAAERWLGFHAESVAAGRLAPPDVVVLDPPRVGASPCMEPLTRVRPRNVVYVSCDPPTLARDLRVLVDGGYRLQSLSALDLFPQTSHVETVARLTL